MMISMPFKPKAQILLQLGEQLIKSESVAILELIKNAYDADAKNVSVSMIDIDVPQVGYIEIIDDGVGMDLWTVQNIWMEPGNTHKKDIVSASERSSLNRLPIGEKGIGRFGVHKLGKKIEMITRSANEQEVYVSIDWNSFANAKYLEDVHVIIEERTPEFFTGDRTGTKLYISDLSACWSRGMLRNVYRSTPDLGAGHNYNLPTPSAQGFWCFVDGKVELGETKEQALTWECKEELAVTLDVGEIFLDVVPKCPDLTVHLTLFHATIREGMPQKLEHNDIRWIMVDEIDQFAFCPADEEILRRLKDAR